MSVGLRTNVSPRHYYTPSMIAGSHYITHLMPVFHYNAPQAGESTACILHLPDFITDPIPAKEKEEPGLLNPSARYSLMPVPMACKSPSSSFIMFLLWSQYSSRRTTTHWPLKFQVDLDEDHGSFELALFVLPVAFLSRLFKSAYKENHGFRAVEPGGLFPIRAISRIQARLEDQNRATLWVIIPTYMISEATSLWSHPSRQSFRESILSKSQRRQKSRGEGS